MPHSDSAQADVAPTDICDSRTGAEFAKLQKQTGKYGPCAQLMYTQYSP